MEQSVYTYIEGIYSDTIDISRIFLYYTRYIYHITTMIYTLNDLLFQVTAVSIKTEEARQYFTNFCVVNFDVHMV